MRENAFDSSTQRGEMSYSAFHYFHFVGVYFFSGPHVGRPTVGTKSFDSASNSILSDCPTRYMTNRSSCCPKKLIIQRVYVAVARFDSRQQ